MTAVTFDAVLPVDDRLAVYYRNGVGRAAFGAFAAADAAFPADARVGRRDLLGQRPERRHEKPDGDHG